MAGIGVAAVVVAGVVLAAVDVIPLPGSGAGAPGSASGPAADAGPVTGGAGGAVVYEVTAPPGSTVTYAAGGTTGSVTGRPSSWPWRVTVPSAGPGGVYTVSVPDAAAGASCAVSRDGELLDRRTADRLGTTLTCSGA